MSDLDHETVCRQGNEGLELNFFTFHLIKRAVRQCTLKLEAIIARIGQALILLGKNRIFMLE